jgi:hypothetical protein
MPSVAIGPIARAMHVAIGTCPARHQRRSGEVTMHELNQVVGEVKTCQTTD